MPLAMSDPAPLNFSDLPRPWLAQLIQHAASGPRGLASAAALSRTCSSIHALSESSAVSYRDIHLDYSISSPSHPFWQWLAKRHGRVVGLTLHVEHSPDAHGSWESPIQQLVAVPDVQLTLAAAEYAQGPHSFMTQWLGQHSHIIGHFAAETHLSPGRTWGLQEFITAAAPCKSLALSLMVDRDDVPLNISCIADVAHSLVSLDFEFKELTGITALPCLTRLSELHLEGYLGLEEPWVPLASLTGLSTLRLLITAPGDPSPLSALTGLSTMSMMGRWVSNLPEYPLFTFSSLQPLSNMLQLEVLYLVNCCTASSLEGLSGLSRLKDLWINESAELCSLEGLSSSLTFIRFEDVQGLKSMAGIEAAVQLQCLSVRESNITSLRPLAALRSLANLMVFEEGGDDGGHLVSLEGI